MIIIQIIPADKWWALYHDDQGDLVKTPLVCFALVRDEDGSKILPMDKADDGKIVPCQEIDNFDSIAHDEEFTE